MEPTENLIRRFQNGQIIEIVETLLNSIDNYFNNEIRVTIEIAYISLETKELEQSRQLNLPKWANSPAFYFKGQS